MTILALVIVEMRGTGSWGAGGEIALLIFVKRGSRGGR